MLREVLQKVVTTLDGLGVPNALIGGLAMAACGVVRATRDVDLLIDWGIHEAKSLAHSLNEHGLAAAFHQGGTDDPLPAVVRVSVETPAGPIHCDILFASAGWQAAAVRDASLLDLQGFGVRVVQAADLFLLKLHAGGPVDLLDAARLYELQTESDRRVWKERALKMGMAVKFAGCLKFLQARE